MGTQQILLIVLSVIIVGAAIAVGIQMFNNQAYSANKSAIAAEAQTYATQVVQFYKTPKSQGGLGNELGDNAKDLIYQYLGWDEEDFDTSKSESGTFFVTSASSDKVIVEGRGNSVRGEKNPYVVTTVTFPEGTITAILSDVEAGEGPVEAGEGHVEGED